MTISGQQANLNVTPLIDVLLVLLIIFMVITPPRHKGLPVESPLPAPSVVSPQAPLVAVLDDAGVLRINTEVIGPERWSQRFVELRAQRADGVLFVSAAGSLEVKPVFALLDTARGAGFGRVALLPHAPATPAAIP